MEVLLWLLFGALPAVAVVFVGVGVGGPRWLALALAVAVCVPFAMAEGLPPWPWDLDLLRGPARPTLWWLLLFGGVLGWAYDLRWAPKGLALVLEVALVALEALG